MDERSVVEWQRPDASRAEANGGTAAMFHDNKARLGGTWGQVLYAVGLGLENDDRQASPSRVRPSPRAARRFAIRPTACLAIGQPHAASRVHGT